MFLISAVLIIIFLVTIFTYLTLPISYDINYKYEKQYTLNWKVNSTQRFVYLIHGIGSSEIIKVKFPYKFSSLTVFTDRPLAWQRDGDYIYVDTSITASQNKVIYFYVNGTNYTLPGVYNNNFLTYKLNLPNVTTYGGDNIQFNCNSINSTGPVFTKFCNNYAFSDFVIANDGFNVSASELIVGSNTYSCDGIKRDISNKLILFKSNYYIELINFNGTVNCSNNIWTVSPFDPTYIYITPIRDDYAYALFGQYTYNVSFETLNNYFRSVLNSYGIPYRGYYDCNTIGGLINTFGDLKSSSTEINNSFISWNTTSFEYDGINIQSGTVLINGATPEWVLDKNKLIAKTDSCNVTFEFFNMTSAVYVMPSNTCSITLPIGVGKVTYNIGDIKVENESYNVAFVGDILSNSNFPTFNVSGPFYIILYRDNYITPYFYKFNSFCPRIV